MPKRIEFNGIVHEFPDDFSDDEIGAALSGGEASPDTAGAGLREVIAQRGLTPDPNQPNRQSVMKAADLEASLIPKADWDALPVSEKMNRFGKAAINMIGGTFLMQRPEETQAMGEHPGATLTAAAMGPALKYGPGLVAKGLGISSARAGQNIQAATAAAKDVPLNVERVGQEGLRAMDLQSAGATMPRAASRLMQRITDPELRPIDFGEARDYYSNISRLSANEFGRLNPTMQRQVGAMRQALHEALTESAETVGKGSQYASGVREYARSAKAAAAGKKIAKVGAGAVGLGVAGNYALDKVLDALARTSGSR